MQSFPHAPDVFALLKELAVMRGEPAAAFVKQEPAPAPPRQTDYQVKLPQPLALCALRWQFCSCKDLQHLWMVQSLSKAVRMEDQQG